MAIARTFLDWNRPALPAVVEYLAEHFQRDLTLDLDSVLLVLPGGRAARRLTELLVAFCEDNQLVLLPPEHCTVGRLPEYLYESHRPFATELTQQLTWVQALKSMDRSRCKRFIPQLPADDNYTDWMDLGALLQRQHRELAADALDFSQVAQRGAQLPGFEDENRWAFLRKIQQDYLRKLDELELWDLQTARLYAIDYNLCRTDKTIILVGTTDMNVATRRMLDQVAGHITALIHAPEALADRFDEHGCLIPDAWQDLQLDITTDQIHVVEGPVEQADEMARCLAALGGHYRADQVVVGVLDEMLVPQLLRQFEEVSIPARWVVGRTVAETAPYRLLDAVARTLERERFIDFASLVRHPDVSSWLSQRVGTEAWLADLDEYYSHHLPARLRSWLDQPAPSVALRQAVVLLDTSLEPLRTARRPLSEWSEPIAQFLSSLYGDRNFQLDLEQDLYTLRALQEIRGALLELQELPAAITPTLSASQSISQLLAQIAGSQIPSPREPDQLELLGWLELPLDTAPALIITGFNEGNVPTSVNSDLFLPNQLRQQLDLIDNRRRYARDAYALSVLQASRQQLTLIAGRFSADHDPLVPSRLAFATDLETMARRAIEFFRLPAAEQEQGIIERRAAPSDSAIVVPQPRRPIPTITDIRVTGFRTYIECPYRYYLRHVLELETIDDREEELNGGAYGTLLHDVLTRFGRDPLAISTEPDRINRFLRRTLNELVERQFGKDRLPAVDVQIAQARHRLQAFARWQARRAEDGWRIVHTETTGESPEPLHLDEKTSVRLKGRIDRIDRRGDEWAILDYKTGDAAKSPHDTHLKHGEWIDLQLPLYRHLARSLGVDGSVQLGYVLLPKETEKVGAVIADWDDAMLQSADEKAFEVAGDIVACKFWPPKRLPAGRVSDFASICQEYAYRPKLEGG